MAEAPSFFASVYALVAQIPPGFVASYGQLAPLRRAMLEAEGVPFTQDGRVAIDRCRWQPAEEG